MGPKCGSVALSVSNIQSLPPSLLPPVRMLAPALVSILRTSSNTEEDFSPPYDTSDDDTGLDDVDKGVKQLLQSTPRHAALVHLGFRCDVCEPYTWTLKQSFSGTSTWTVSGGYRALCLSEGRGVRHIWLHVCFPLGLLPATSSGCLLRKIHLNI